MKIPERLSERLKEMGQDSKEIYSIRPLKARMRMDARVNDDQRSSKGLASSIDGSTPVPRMKGFFFTEESNEQDMRTPFILDAASLVPVIALDPNPDELILDMAAAPGMKTMLIARLMHDKGCIVACEISRMRMLRLKNNIKKFGCEICKPVRCDSSRFKWNENFDRILLDAPCSGEGMTGKQKKVFGIWSEKRIMRLQKMQKKMIRRGFELLKEGGILVYSTCTFAPEENEEVVSWLLENNENARAEEIKIPGLRHSAGISRWKEKSFPEHEKFIRIWPQQNNTNGMFVARIRKL